MPQYVNQSQSGTVMRTSKSVDKMEPVIDRVMMIAERLVNAEKALASYGKIIADQTAKITELQGQIEGLKLSHFQAPEPAPVKTPARRAKSPTTKSTTTK